MELDRMALKVKEMFPQIPLASIRADLGKEEDDDEDDDEADAGDDAEASGSMEETASAILAGKVAEAGDGWRSPLEARKWDLIEANRKAYLAKRGASQPE